MRVKIRALLDQEFAAGSRQRWSAAECERRCKMESTAGFSSLTVAPVILAASSATSGWVILLLIAAAIVWYWLATGAHKTVIRMEVHKLQAKPIRIRWLPWHDSGEDNDTFYEVTLELPSGKRVSALCKCSNLSEVSWQSTPWSQELPQEPAPELQFDPVSQRMRVVADCSRCGYGLQQGWVACPNCGTELGA